MCSDAFSLVVLPSAGLSSDPDQALFVQGLCPAVSTDLSCIAGAFTRADNNLANALVHLGRGA